MLAFSLFHLHQYLMPFLKTPGSRSHLNHSLIKSLFIALLTSSLLIGAAPTWADDTDFDFFSDQPIAEETLIIVPPPKPEWITIGGPIALVAFFFMACLIIRWLFPFKQTGLQFNLHDLPIAAQRGIGMAVVLYGIALVFGGLVAHHKVNLHGDATTYFQNMSIGKLMAFTHAHLFGFTTSFFIVGIPFSLHFSRLKVYQWIFPIGLIASLTDIISWWGMKFVSENFAYITFACGLVFTVCYVWMLVGLVRVLFFPSVKWFPDFISEDQERRWNEQHKNEK
jgi:hypothetical protein